MLGMLKSLIGLVWGRVDEHDKARAVARRDQARSWGHPPDVDEYDKARAVAWLWDVGNPPSWWRSRALALEAQRARDVPHIFALEAQRAVDVVEIERLRWALGGSRAGFPSWEVE